MAERSRWYDGDGPTPDQIIDQIARDLGIGRWSMSMALWDDDAIADHKLAKIKAAFEQIPGVEVRFSKHAPQEIPKLENHSERVLGGVPAMEWNMMLRWYGSDAGAHLGNGLVAPLVGTEAWRLHTLIRGVVEREMQLDYLASPMVINARSFIHACGAILGRLERGGDAALVQTCARRIVREAAKAGFGEYRAHLDYMDLAAEHLQLRRPRLPAVPRKDQGRRGSERDPRAGQAVDLARVLPTGTINRQEDGR